MRINLIARGDEIGEQQRQKPLQLYQEGREQGRMLTLIPMLRCFPMTELFAISRGVQDNVLMFDAVGVESPDINHGVLHC